MAVRGARLVIAVLAALALPAMASATPPGANGRIVFASTRDGGPNQELYSVAPDGTGLTRLTWSPTVEQHPVWSPDGTRIAFGSFAEGNQSIHVMNANGSDERRLSPDGFGSDDMEPAWSPDGSRIAFSSTRGGTWQLWTMTAEGSGLTRLTSEFSTSPAWSPDGGSIAYLRQNGAIAVMNADGTGARQLTFPPAGTVDERPSWSPDGARLVFPRRATFGNTPELHLVDADGGNERQLTFAGGANRFPVWSPDGTQIVFTHDRLLHVIEADGSALRALTSWGEDLTPDWGTSTALPVPEPPGAPTIQIYSPEPRPYPAGYEVPAFYFCESATSFVVSCEGDVPFGTPVDMETTGTRTFTVRATDLEGRTSTRTVTFEVLDLTDPTIVPRAPADGAEYELGQAVEVDFECADERGGSGIELCDGELQRGQPLDTSRLGSYTVHFWAVDRAHNVAQLAVTYRVVDRTPPTISTKTPQQDAVYVLGETVLASYACADEGGSGIGSCTGSVPPGTPLDTSSIGTKSFTVTAKDRAHNATTVNRSYRVVYPFGGFLAPLLPSPATASFRAGETLPVKFSLGADHGLSILAAAPSWQPFECATGTPFGDRSSAAGKLSYVGSGRYQYLAETDAGWAGSCRRFALTLDDGTTHEANVGFVRR